MKTDSISLINQYLRVKKETFSVRDFVSAVGKEGVKIRLDEGRDILQYNSNVFELKDGSFITRAGVFSDRIFTFKPSKFEVENGVFFIGHRCIPFVDSNNHSSTLDFFYKNKLLEKKRVEVENSIALDMYSLYGEEYAPQYAALDVANAELKLLEGDYFSLPYKIFLTGVSIQELIDSGLFKYGDRIQCKVIDWNLGYIEIDVVPHGTDVMQINMQDVEREAWYEKAENMFLESFDLFGPCASIEYQLTLVFAKYIEDLTVPICGSIEELIHRSKKIAFEEFGVETRLWKKGESVPVVGPWNQDEQPAEEEKNVKGAFADIDFLPIYVYENVLKDSIAFNDFDVKELIAKLYPKLSESGIASQNFVMLHLKTRHDILANEYNRFVDFDIKYIRRKILNLYFRVLKIINSIELACPDLSKYPQQPLVIISQIYEHLLQTLELIESNPKLITDSINDIESSVEGMEYNLDCSYQELKRVIDKETKKGFVLIKHKGLK